MIGVIAAFLSLFGLMGVWPVLTKPEWIKKLTWAPSTDPALSLTGGFRLGWKVLVFPDGLILMIGVMFLSFTLFLPTSRGVVWVRRFILSFLMLFFGIELFIALSQNVPFQHVSGLLYSEFMLIVGWIFSLTNLGSHNAFMSTLAGMPKSDFKTMMEQGQTLLNEIRRSIRWRVVFEGAERTWNKESLAIGRDPSWADMVIPPHYQYVSRRHVILRPAGARGMSLEFVGARYSVRVNGELHKPDERVVMIYQPSCELDLVAGYGPVLRVEMRQETAPVFSPKTMTKVGGMVRDRYRLAKTQVRIAVVVLVLGVLGGGMMNWSTTLSVMAKLQHYNNLVAQARQETQKAQEELKRINRQLQQIRREREKLEQALAQEKAKREEYERALDSLRRVQDSLMKNARQSVDLTALREVAEEYFQQHIGRFVYCGIVMPQGRTGTIWIGNRQNHTGIFTAAHVVDRGIIFFSPDPQLREFVIRTMSCEPFIEALVQQKEWIQSLFASDDQDEVIGAIEEPVSILAIGAKHFQTAYDKAWHIFPKSFPGEMYLVPVITYEELLERVGEKGQGALPAMWLGFPSPKPGEEKIPPSAAYGAGLCSLELVHSSGLGKVVECPSLYALEGASGSPVIALDPNDFSVIGAFGVISARQSAGEFRIYVSPFFQSELDAPQ